MKNTYSFSQNDVDAITTALKVLPYFEFITPDTADAVFTLSTSVGQKLIMQKPLNNRESDFIVFVVDSAYRALRNEIEVDAIAIEKLRPYLFTFNKLQSAFSSSSL